MVEKNIYLSNYNFYGGVVDFPFYAHLVTRYSDGHITLKSFEVYSDGGISPLICKPIKVDVKTFYGFIHNKYCAYPASSEKYFDLDLMREFGLYCFDSHFWLTPYTEWG